MEKQQINNIAHCEHKKCCHFPACNCMHNPLPDKERELIRQISDATIKMGGMKNNPINA